MRKTSSFGLKWSFDPDAGQRCERTPLAIATRPVRTHAAYVRSAANTVRSAASSVRRSALSSPRAAGARRGPHTSCAADLRQHRSCNGLRWRSWIEMPPDTRAKTEDAKQHKYAAARHDQPMRQDVYQESFRAEALPPCPIRRGMLSRLLSEGCPSHKIRHRNALRYLRSGLRPRSATLRGPNLSIRSALGFRRPSLPPGPSRFRALPSSVRFRLYRPHVVVSVTQSAT